MVKEWAAVLESAARLQQLVPDVVLVGGTASAIHAQHRFSFYHDHVWPTCAFDSMRCWKHSKPPTDG